MKRPLTAAAALCLIIGSAGCSHLTVLRTRELHAVRDSLSAEIDSLRTQLRAEQRTQDEMLRLIRADQQVHFGEIGKKVSDLGSLLSENQYRLSRIDEKTADFQKRFEEKLAADSAAAQSKNAEVEKLFQIATADFNAGRFDIAMNGFKDLMMRFPDLPQGRESEYWSAECANAKKEYAEAEKGYLLYIKNNPQGNRVCAALYKLGLCYEKLGKSKSKELVWKKLADQCPDAEETGLVKAKEEKK